MPFPRNIFIRKTDGEGKLSPKWSRSPGSTKSPKSPKSPRTHKSPKPLTFTEQNTEYLNQCIGCNNVEDLIRGNIAYKNDGGNKLPLALLHNSFDELESCANKCQICRLFRQSLLLEEVTFDGMRKFQETRGKVTVNWTETIMTAGKPGGYLTIKVEDRPERAGVVDCNSKNDIAHLALRPDARDTAVIDQAREWLNVCVTSHIGVCDNLRFSRETPQLLIEIFSPDSIRLCEDQAVEYVALSYCWGTETEEVKHGKTVKANLDRRRQKFSTKDLPATVRDALYIVHAMGIRYAWVDSLCIIQDTPKGVETMHKVYSNALFTLCACSTSRATANLLERRETWTLRTEPCRLGGQWLTTFDMSLNELRLRSPLAERAWTLQEERLSPRMLYVSSSRLYWSCARGCEVELRPTYEKKPNKVQRPVYAMLDRDTEIPLAQEFLLTCYDRNADLYSFWAEIVKAYASRNMTHRKDRLIALSGLAARYLSANGPDEYLAGIWANKLSEGLAWKVQRAIEDDRSGDDDTGNEWPSWSWAVLPLQTAIQTESKSARSRFFHRNINASIMDPGVDFNVEYAVKRGANVKELRLTGRLRALWKSSSRPVEWSSISKRVEGIEKFTFATHPEQNIHAIQTESGHVLVYEDRQREIVGQLDFRHDVSRLQANDVDLMALEIEKTTMLLLEACGKGLYRRIGVAWDVRNSYFALAEQVDLTLR